jgi:small conductance mechanosensitive channel
VDSFGESEVVIKARLKTLPIQQWAVGREYRRRLKKAFDEKAIEIPFPHRTLYMGEASRPFLIKGTLDHAEMETP